MLAQLERQSLQADLAQARQLLTDGLAQHDFIAEHQYGQRVARLERELAANTQVAAQALAGRCLVLWRPTSDRISWHQGRFRHQGFGAISEVGEPAIRGGRKRPLVVPRPGTQKRRHPTAHHGCRTWTVWLRAPSRWAVRRRRKS